MTAIFFNCQVITLLIHIDQLIIFENNSLKYHSMQGGFGFTQSSEDPEDRRNYRQSTGSIDVFEFNNEGVQLGQTISFYSYDWDNNIFNENVDGRIILKREDILYDYRGNFIYAKDLRYFHNRRGFWSHSLSREYKREIEYK